jgi:hypothetical protein
MMVTMTETPSETCKTEPFLKQNCRVCIYFMNCIDNTAESLLQRLLGQI